MLNKTREDIYLNRPYLRNRLLGINQFTNNNIEKEKDQLTLSYQAAVALMEEGRDEEAENKLLEIQKQYEDLQEYLIGDYDNTEMPAEFIFAILSNLSILSCKKGDYETGRKYYKEIFTNFKAKHESFFSTRDCLTVIKVAELQKTNKLYFSALENFLKAIPVANLNKLTNIYIELSDIHFILGEQLENVNREDYYHKALLFQEKALEAYKKSLTIQEFGIEKLHNISRNISDIYLNKALIYKKLNNPRKAEKYFEKSFVIDRNNNQAKEQYCEYLTNTLEILRAKLLEVNNQKELKQYTKVANIIERKISYIARDLQK